MSERDHDAEEAEDAQDEARHAKTEPPRARKEDDAQKQDEAASHAPPALAAGPAPAPGGGIKAWILGRPDPFIGGGIATAYVAWLLATARGLGFSRDEGFYFTAAYEYKRWFSMLLEKPARAIERGAIDPIWSNNHEHPSLMKSLFALSHLLFHDKLKLFSDESTAFRFPGMLMMGLALFVTYMFAARAYSRRAGIAATLALGLMPNVFYHAHLACFDVPIMAMWTTCIYVYWRAEKERSFGWIVLAGVVYGLTLETKHNAWMLPAVFLPHALAVHGRAITKVVSRTARIPIPATLVSMATLGPAVFLLLWPWLWNDTLPRIQEYVNFHVHHEYYNIEFLGRTYFGPPSPIAYMPVMIVATVPTATLVLFAFGAFDRARLLVRRTLAWGAEVLGRTRSRVASSDPQGTDLLFFLAIAVALGPFLLPRTPIFGGTKHWITAYPFIAILAGRGFDVCWSRIARLLERRVRQQDGARRLVLQAALLLATFGGAFAVTSHSHPFGLSAYVPFVGGTAGGADLGLNRQFWGFTTESLGPWLAENAKSGETMYIMDTAWPSWQRMVAEKRVPQTMRGASSPADAELSIVHHEQHMNEVDYNIWTEYRSSLPAYVLTHDGVPIITVYRRTRPRIGR